MSLYQKSRAAMVESQIRTNGVVSEAVLVAFETMPREEFVPAALKSVAYADKHVPLNNDRVMFEPMVHAKILEAIAPQPHEVALDIGTGYGYSAAILSRLVTTVIALESRQNLIERAEKLLADHDVCNVVFQKSKLQNGCPEHAPFDVIIFNGAVSNVPSDVLDQLAVGGRLVALVQSDANDVGQVVLFQRAEGGHISERVLFEASMPYLQGFTPEERFSF